jgi:hypothetical protein
MSSIRKILGKKPARITRSISFEKNLMSHCKKRAKELNRSVNWVVNNLVRLDVNAPLAAAGTAVV